MLHLVGRHALPRKNQVEHWHNDDAPAYPEQSGKHPDYRSARKIQKKKNHNDASLHHETWRKHRQAAPSRAFPGLTSRKSFHK